MPFRVSDWDRYEADTGHARCKSPLKWVRTFVHGHEHGKGWRKLLAHAGRDAMAAFGLFIKLVELAADDTDERRDGTIYTDRGGIPAGVKEISESTGFDERDVDRHIKHLLAVGWVVLIDNGVSFSRNSPRFLENSPGTPFASNLVSSSSVSSSEEGMQGGKQIHRHTAADIERIYSAYPRKVGKSAALKAIARAIGMLIGRGEEFPAQWLLGRVTAFSASPAGQAGKFTPHPATWFNDGRYDDDPAEWNRRDGHPEPQTPSDMRRSREYEQPQAPLPRLGA